MPLLIDCYNLLHAEKPPALAGLDVAGLCRALGHTRWVREPITVVCDGQPSPLNQVESPVASVTVSYSGGHRTADQLIIHTVDHDSAPRRLTVVSSDRAIQKAARRRRARVMSSETFLHHLAQHLARREPPPGAEKPSPEDMPAGEVDRWLERFGYDMGRERAEPADPEADPDVPWPPW